MTDLCGALHVTGDVRENSHGRQGHEHRSYKVTCNPARNHSHKHPSAGQHTVQVKGHPADENTMDLSHYLSITLRWSLESAGGARLQRLTVWQKVETKPPTTWQLLSGRALAWTESDVQSEAGGSRPVTGPGTLSSTRACPGKSWSSGWQRSAPPPGFPPCMER